MPAVKHLPTPVLPPLAVGFEPRHDLPSSVGLPYRWTATLRWIGPGNPRAYPPEPLAWDCSHAHHQTAEEAQLCALDKLFAWPGEPVGRHG